MYPDSGYKRAHAQSVCTRPFSRVQRFSKILQRTSKSGSNALANQNAALDRAQTRFVRMPEHEFESRFEICVLIGQHITSAY